MARPIEFDRERVLRLAINQFWLKGYAGTSIKNLVDATGLQPGSIYSAFGDKRGLFQASLDAYFSMMTQNILKILNKENETPTERLSNFFYHLVNESESDTEKKGCLLINTLSEIPVQDREINLRLQEMFTAIETKFEDLIVESQENGEIALTKDPSHMAKFLITGIFGLRLFNKTQPDCLSLKSIVDNLLLVLKS